MQLRPLLFEQEFHVRAGMCYTGMLIRKKTIATQELEIEAPSEESQINTKQLLRSRKLCVPTL